MKIIYSENDGSKMKKEDIEMLQYTGCFEVYGKDLFRIVLFNDNFGFREIENIATILGISEEEYRIELKKYNIHHVAAETSFFNTKESAEKMINDFLEPLLQKQKIKVEPKMVVKKLIGERIDY